MKGGQKKVLFFFLKGVSMASALVGFGGSRALSSSWCAAVASVVASVVGAGRGVAVCSGGGASAFVRAACPSAVVFAPAFAGVGALPARASACVRACAASGPGSGWVAFVSGPCPAGVVPASAWRSGRPASGSWAEVALAVGLGLPVVVFWCAPGPVALPAWGGSWVPAGRGVWVSGWRFVPAASLF
jgi:hypothetical protein